MSRLLTGVVRWGVLFSCLIVANGCGSGEKVPDLAAVKGVVKLDGKPIADVVVKFEPKDGGGASSGTTGADGQFELKHVNGKAGAVVGNHDVQIMTANEADATVVVPAKYNLESTLTATVEKGKTNEIPAFELTTQ